MAEVSTNAGPKLVINTGLSLPEEKSRASHNINDYHWLIHGAMKIGKTSFAVQEDKVFVLEFDPFQKAYEIYQRHVPNWDVFVKFLELLEKRAASGSYPYKRVIIDGADICYRRCQEWVQKKLVVDHISEPKWGVGWDTMSFTFASVVDRYMRLPGGCWWLCHSEERETKDRNGAKIDKLIPLMKGAAEEIITGRCDGVAAYDYFGKDRALIIVGDDRTGAGHRVSGHFQTPDGRAVKEILMGHSAKEGWLNFNMAFNNKQAYATIAEWRKSAK